MNNFKYFLVESKIESKLDKIEQKIDIAMSKINTKKEYKSPKYLTRKEVADMLNISYSTLHRLINRGTLPCRKVGRKSLFLLSDVENVVLTLNV